VGAGTPTIIAEIQKQIFSGNKASQSLLLSEMQSTLNGTLEASRRIKLHILELIYLLHYVFNSEPTELS
jgi:hypothetical protein